MMYVGKSAKHISNKNNEIDRDIEQYIKENKAVDLNRVIADDDRWLVFFHLSKLREAILSWYEFDSNSALLEIGAGYGALTGQFCERCKYVAAVERYEERAAGICERYKEKDNLDVYAGTIEDFKFKCKFDYITLIGTLEYQGDGKSEIEVYAEYLKKVKALLKPNGKLIIATENRYGIRYFCGAEDAFTKRPFDGINHYPYGTNAYAFCRSEIIDIIEMAEIKKYKFYYPLPDYKVTQVIYSQEYLPKGTVKERVIPYYRNRDSLVAYENDLYDDLVKNNVFEFMSNSFLIECVNSGEPCDVIYAAISADRKAGESYVTAIHKGGYVTKKDIERNSGGAKAIKSNLEYLSERGINVIESEIHNDCLRMPYIQKTTLSEYLGKVVNKNRNEFIELIDELYRTLLRSSEHVPYEKNRLIAKSVSEEEWGIILKKSFIDMIPINCFYEDGDLIFFDQEFVRDSYPVKYTLFRMLMYLYLFFPKIEEIVPIIEMKKRYEITENIWEACKEEEERFVKDNRNYDLYRQFLKWTNIDKNKMYDNAKRLKEGR